MRSLGKNHRAECCRWQEHHLAIPQMRREQARDIVLRKCRSRAQDQFSFADGVGNVRCHQRQLNVVPAVRVLQQDARARRAMRGHLPGIAPPQPDLMALQHEIACGRERAVAAAKHRDLHMASPDAGAVSWSCRSRKCWTLPRAVRGRSSTKTMSRGTLNRASCVSTCALRASASTKHPARRIT